MLCGVALVERPVGTLTVFTFLYERTEASISDFISSGWNRTTIRRSLGRLLSLELIQMSKTSRFPRFKKMYTLTSSGSYLAGYVRLAEEVCKGCGLFSLEEISRLPKGCLRVIVHFSRRGWHGLSSLLKDTQLSAKQAYRCLATLEEKGVLVIQRKREERERILACRLRPEASRVSLVFDALDGALDRTLRGLGENRHRLPTDQE